VSSANSTTLVKWLMSLEKPFMYNKKAQAPKPIPVELLA
jgi:hypothetical protein